MATTEQRFEHLSFKAAAPRRSPEVAGAWYRLILVLAAAAALVTWGLVAPSVSRSDGDRLGLSATSADQPVYDGHGKWGGYLPEWRSRSEILQDAGVIEER